MRVLLPVVLVIAIAGQVQAQAPAQVPVWTDGVERPVVQVDYSNPGLNPSQWTLTLHSDGSGHFRSQANPAANAGRKIIDTPSVDRDIQLSSVFAGQLFATAQKHKWFNDPCESHMKVAFQGWKTLTYTGPEGKGTCTFNYSKDRDLENLGDSLQAAVLTILEGARLEVLLQHDRLGLDAEMEFLSAAASDGRAQEFESIKGILERVAGDDAVLDRVRRRAREILARVGE